MLRKQSKAKLNPVPAFFRDVKKTLWVTASTADRLRPCLFILRCFVIITTKTETTYRFAEVQIVSSACKKKKKFGPWTQEWGLLHDSVF